jgi:hypothetical protein
MLSFVTDSQKRMIRRLPDFRQDEGSGPEEYVVDLEFGTIAFKRRFWQGNTIEIIGDIPYYIKKDWRGRSVINAALLRAKIQNVFRSYGFDVYDLHDHRRDMGDGRVDVHINKMIRDSTTIVSELKKIGDAYDRTFKADAFR